MVGKRDIDAGSKVVHVTVELPGTLIVPTSIAQVKTVLDPNLEDGQAVGIPSFSTEFMMNESMRLLINPENPEAHTIQDKENYLEAYFYFRLLKEAGVEAVPQRTV